MRSAGSGEHRQRWAGHRRGGAADRNDLRGLRFVRGRRRGVAVGLFDHDELPEHLPIGAHLHLDGHLHDRHDRRAPAPSVHDRLAVLTVDDRPSPQVLRRTGRAGRTPTATAATPRTPSSCVRDGHVERFHQGARCWRATVIALRRQGHRQPRRHPDRSHHLPARRGFPSRRRWNTAVAAEFANDPIELVAASLHT